MAVGVLAKLGCTTVEITASEYIALIKKDEQLRILKNYTRLDEVILKENILTLIKAMEANNE